MRRLLGQVIRYLADLARTLADQWEAFWYSPADPTLPGLIRILAGSMLLYTHAVWGLAFDDFFGPSSWLGADLVREIQRNQFAYSFWTWIPAEWAWLVHTASMAVLLLFTVGFWTRATSFLALVVAISYAQRVPAALFGLDQINVMLTLYLTLGDCGRALSIDRWLAWRREVDGPSRAAPSVAANFGLRLIQVHMCVIYFFAGISKLQGPAWWNGEAMWLAFANLEYQSTDMTWLAWHPWLLNVITYTTVLWEMSFCTLIWRPVARPLILVAAVLLHVGIGVCLGMWTFGLIMLVGCAAFLPGEEVRKLVAGLVSKPGESTLTAIAADPAPARMTAPPAGSGPRPPRQRSRPSEPFVRTLSRATAGAGPADLSCLDLVPVFMVATQTTLDCRPGEWTSIASDWPQAFEPRYIVVSFDSVQTPVANS